MKCLQQLPEEKPSFDRIKRPPKLKQWSQAGLPAGFPACSAVFAIIA
jgi:hypothetical protein